MFDEAFLALSEMTGSLLVSDADVNAIKNKW